MIPKWIWLPDEDEASFYNTFTKPELRKYNEIAWVNFILTIIILIMMYKDLNYTHTFLGQVIKIGLYVGFFYMRYDHIQKMNMLKKMEAK